METTRYAVLRAKHAAAIKNYQAALRDEFTTNEDLERCLNAMEQAHTALSLAARTRLRPSGIGAAVRAYTEAA